MGVVHDIDVNTGRYQIDFGDQELVLLKKENLRGTHTPEVHEHPLEKRDPIEEMSVCDGCGECEPKEFRKGEWYTCTEEGCDFVMCGNCLETVGPEGQVVLGSEELRWSRLWNWAALCGKAINLRTAEKEHVLGLNRTQGLACSCLQYALWLSMVDNRLRIEEEEEKLQQDYEARYHVCDGKCYHYFGRGKCRFGAKCGFCHNEVHRGETKEEAQRRQIG